MANKIFTNKTSSERYVHVIQSKEKQHMATKVGNTVYALWCIRTF